MEEDFYSYTKKKLIEMAKQKGLSTSGTKSLIIERLEEHAKKRRPTPMKKITEDQYRLEMEILHQEQAMEDLENEMKRQQRHLRKLRLDAQLEGSRCVEHEEEGDAIDKADEEEDEEEETQLKGAVGGKAEKSKREIRQENNETLLELISIPRPTMHKFDGNPLEYHTFMNSFESSIGHSRLSDGAKLTRLLDFCIGKAHRVIKQCASDPINGYKRAKKILKERFGDNYVISEAYITDLTSGPQIKQNEVTNLQDFLDDLRSCVDAFESMGMIEEIDTRVRMVRIVEKLPYQMQTGWRKIATASRREKGAYPDINTFVNYVEQCVEEVADPVFGVKQRPTTTQPDKKQKTASLQTNSDKTGSSGKPRKQVPCPKCDGAHPLFLCSKFKSMSAQDRLKLVKEKNCCINCLKPGHAVETCRNPRICNHNNECKERHSFLLHDALKGGEKKDTEVTTNGATVLSSGLKTNGKISLPCVEIAVSNGSNRIVTKALLDSGSDRTYCKSSLTDMLQLQGHTKSIEMSTMHGVRQVNICEVNLSVSSLFDDETLELRGVYSTHQFPCLQGSVATRRDIENWSHLADLPVTDTQDVLMLIGQDNPEAFQIKEEVRFGNGHEPYAIRYSLGWTISGPVGTQVQTTATAICNFAIGDEQLNDQVSKFFELDHVPNYNPDCHSVNDKRVINLWEETTKVIDGHYSLELPFKNDPPNLPDNRATAEK
jgi:hypothetical protein